MKDYLPHVGMLANSEPQCRWWLRSPCYYSLMAKLPDPRSLVLNKEVKVTNGIKGHQHREKNVLPKMYFEIHEEEID